MQVLPYACWLVLVMIVITATAQPPEKEGSSLHRAYKNKKSALVRSAQRVRHCPNPPQHRYELLRDTVSYLAGHSQIRWSMATGLLLGAMRQTPPGFIQHDDDIDLWLPGKDLFAFQAQFVKDGGQHGKAKMVSGCCGFGWRIEHVDDECSYLDLFALSLADKPFGALESAVLSQASSADHVADPSSGGGKVWVMPQKDPVMMLHPELWQPSQAHPGEQDWVGTPESLFPDYYIQESELFPLNTMQMYGLTVNIPSQAWAILHRLYGPDCDHVDDVAGDLDTNPELRKPADVDVDVAPVQVSLDDTMKHRHHLHHHAALREVEATPALAATEAAVEDVSHSYTPRGLQRSDFTRPSASQGQGQKPGVATEIRPWGMFRRDAYQ